MSGINGKKAHPVQKLKTGGDVMTKKFQDTAKMPPMRKTKPGPKIKGQDFKAQFG